MLGFFRSKKKRMLDALNQITPDDLRLRPTLTENGCLSPSLDIQHQIRELRAKNEKLESKLDEMVKGQNNPDLYCGKFSVPFGNTCCARLHETPARYISFRTAEDHYSCLSLKDDNGQPGRPVKQGHFGILRDVNCPGYVAPEKPKEQGKKK